MFTRYGTERSRTVIEAADITETLREGVWNQGQLFRVWHEYRQALTSSDGKYTGWLCSPAPRNQTAKGNADDNEAVNELDDSFFSWNQATVLLSILGATYMNNTNSALTANCFGRGKNKCQTSCSGACASDSTIKSGLESRLRESKKRAGKNEKIK